MQAIVECPKCGFSQPRDKYCASCGVDMDSLFKKPAPLWKRVLQNPNLHLSLICMLILVVVGWIFYTQRALVSREMGLFMDDTPISSREAGDPDAAGAAAASPTPTAPARAAARPVNAPSAEEGAAADLAAANAEATSAAGAEGAATTTTAAKAVGEIKQMELTFWEIPREQLTQITGRADKEGTGDPGAFTFRAGDEALKSIRAQGEAIGAARSVAVSSTGSTLSVESAPTAPEGFRFSLQVHSGENIRWEFSSSVPGGEVVSMNSSVPMVKDGVLLLILDAPQRNIAQETMTKLSDGPWSIYSSPEFRVGMTEWVAVIHLK